jgi:hypothetical protein
MDMELYGAFGVLTLGGSDGAASVKFSDTFYAFKAQLVAFVRYLQTGVLPFAFEETAELMQLVIAGITSRNEGGREVPL